MTKQQVKEILDRVLTWPFERQADLAQVAKIMETQDQSGLTLSEEQVAEVKRRLDQDDAKTITLAEFNQHLRRRYGI
jgi:F0F1-type ATP synthase beta subunit